MTDRFARALGWTSLALGTAQLAAPRAVTRLCGVDDAPGATTVARLVGGRELLHAALLLGAKNPAQWAWTRVAGDTMDLGVLGRAAANRTGTRRTRALCALGAVAGIAVLDAVCARRGTAKAKGPLLVRASITINKPPRGGLPLLAGAWRTCPASCRTWTRCASRDQRRSHWKAKAPAGPVSGTPRSSTTVPASSSPGVRVPGAGVATAGVVSFTDAPGGRGTEVRVELEYEQPGGAARPPRSPSCSASSPSSRSATTCAASSRSWRPARWSAPRAAPRAPRPAAAPRSAARTSRCGGGADMKANVWMGRDKVEVRDVPDPQILNARDAIVRVTSTAICGSDLHLYDGYIPTMREGRHPRPRVHGRGRRGRPGRARTCRSATGSSCRSRSPAAPASPARRGLYSLCENSNPNAGMAEKLMGHAPAGIFGYSHMLGGFAGGQAEYARVPFADVGPIKIEDGLPDEQVLFLSDIFPTGYMGAEMCDIKPGESIAVWGARAGRAVRRSASAYLLGAEQVIAIDRFPYRLQHGRASGPAPRPQLRGGRRLDALRRDDRRARPGRLHRRRRHGGPPPPPAHVRLRPRQAGRPDGDRAAARAARGDHGLPQRRHGLRHRRLRRVRGQVPDGLA